jgi:hypothetical protein
MRCGDNGEGDGAGTGGSLSVGPRSPDSINATIWASQPGPVGTLADLSGGGWPGPRPYAGIIAARRLSSGAGVPLIEIPQEYHNSPEARSLQRQGLLPCQWGSPPKTEP